MKKVLRIICNILLFVCLLVFGYLTIARGVFGQGFIKVVNAQSVSVDELYRLTDYSNETMHRLLEPILKEYQVPTEFLDFVLDSNSYKSLLDDYINDFVAYSISGGQMPHINQKKVNEVLEIASNKYQMETKKELDKTKLATVSINIATALDEKISEISTKDKVKKSVQFLLNDWIYYGCIIIIILLVIAVALLSQKKAVIDLGVDSFAAGYLFLLSACLLRLDVFKHVKVVFENKFQNINQLLWTSGWIFVGVGFLLLILYIIFLKNKKGSTN